ncbi:MAG: DUF5711 family protein [Lachnospiraceae bacterium]|nr:DUF5711 family protein [Lachnospiraceae bacterium]
MADIIKPGSKPILKLAKPISKEKIKKSKRLRLKRILQTSLPIIGLVFLMLLGNYLILTNQSYDGIRTTSVYARNSSEANRYEPFANGIVRYNRDSVVFLNRRNREQWIQLSQMANPMFTASADVFVVADQGGNGIKVFTILGLKGSFETPFPIERIAVSNQGIVSAILRNDENPMIATYDATGNLLVENQIPLRTMGYPTALALSKDGTMLAVGYLSINGGVIRSRVVYYNFAHPDPAVVDFVVVNDEYEDYIVVDIHFLEDDISVVITDRAFMIYQGNVNPTLQHHISMEREIKSVFYGRNHVGFVLMDVAQGGNEVRLYNQSGEMVLNRNFEGDYGNVLMIDDDIIMYDNMSVFIMSRWGIIRYQGFLDINPLLVMPAFGVNRYYIVGSNELRIINLVR